MAIPQSSNFLFRDKHIWSAAEAEFCGMATFAVLASVSLLRGRVGLSLLAYLAYGICSVSMNDFVPMARADLNATDYAIALPINFLVPVLATTSLLFLSAMKQNVQPTKHSWLWLTTLIIVPLTPISQALNGFASLQTAGVLAVGILLVIALGWFDARFAVAVAIAMSIWALPFVSPLMTVGKGSQAGKYETFDAYWGRSPSTYILFIGFLVMGFVYAAWSSRRMAMPALRSSR